MPSFLLSQNRFRFIFLLAALQWGTLPFFSIKNLSSLSAWFVALFSLLLAALSAWVAYALPQRMLAFLQTHLRIVTSFLWLSSLLLACFSLAPDVFWQQYAGYASHLRPLAWISFAVLLQALFFLRLTDFSAFSRPAFLSLLGFILAILSLPVGMWLSGLGITPDNWFWNGAGVPLTTLQFVIILFLASFFHILQPRPSRWVDLFLALCLFLFAAWLWTSIPSIKHHFLSPARPPFHQPYPASDSLIYDSEAWSLLLSNPVQVDIRQTSVESVYVFYSKPFYVAFLAILHRFTETDYAQMSMLHAVLMAVLAPLLYYFGKDFHSRFLGILLALAETLRQYNALAAIDKISSVNPRLFVTEVISMLFIVLLVWIGFRWLRSPKKHYGAPLLLGGVWGVLSLLRLNALGLLPVLFGGAAFLSLRRHSDWRRHAAALAIGWMLVTLPWFLVGRDVNGVPLFLVSAANLTTEFWMPDQQAVSLSERLSQFFQPTSSSAAPPLQQFPAFILNHTLHNSLNAFLTLPNSISPAEQSATALASRPAWSASDTWHGEMPLPQVIFSLFNLLALAGGLWQAWRRWGWAGLFPFLLFWNYILVLGASHVSGGRYLVPVDWVIFFYYAVAFSSLVTAPAPAPVAPGSPLSLRFALALLLLLALPLPAAYTGTLAIRDACAVAPAYRAGIALYPARQKDGSTSVYFIGCQERLALTLPPNQTLPADGFVILNADLQVSPWEP